MMIKFLLLLELLACPVFSKDPILLAGTIGHGIASGLDGYSSWNKIELNPILGSRYGSRACVVKGMSFITITYISIRLNKKHKWVSRMIPVAFAGFYTGLAGRNFR
jgi:hypothetical protein